MLENTIEQNLTLQDNNYKSEEKKTRKKECAD